MHGAWWQQKGAACWAAERQLALHSGLQLLQEPVSAAAAAGMMVAEVAGAAWMLPAQLQHQLLPLELLADQNQLLQIRSSAITLPWLVKVL